MLLGCSKGIAQPFHSISVSRQVNGVLCSLFCLLKKTQTFLLRRLSLSDALGPMFLFISHPPAPEVATLLTVSALLVCAVSPPVLPVCMKMLI